MNTKDEILKEVKEDEVYQKLSKTLNESERLIVESSLNSFVENFSEPLVDIFQKIFNDPKAVEELKKELAKV